MIRVFDSYRCGAIISKYMLSKHVLSFFAIEKNIELIDIRITSSFCWKHTEKQDLLIKLKKFKNS